MDTATHNNHSLPPAPQQGFDFGLGQAQNFNPNVPQQPIATQQRRPRAFSHKSDKSHKSQKSSGSNKFASTETSAEKEAKRLHSKADPTLAMQEAEPSAVAAGVKSQLASLRGMQLKDVYGNPITEPDRSNPTRSRWERPLDTIRSFEAAIDGAYNRKSMIRSDTDSVAWNRRSSYFANSNGARFPHDSYYGSRPQSVLRPESNQHEFRQGGGMGRDSYYDGYNNGGNNGQLPPMPPPHSGGRRGYPPRMGSEPQIPVRVDPNVYPVPNNHRSYETVASASGSGTSGEPAGYQTDPTSSDNSSIERMQAPRKPRPPPEAGNDYGIGFSQPSAFSVGVRNSHMSGGGVPGQSYPPSQLHNSNDAPPPPPPQKGGSTLRKPVAASLTKQQSPQGPAEPEKRKSWLSRRFSKK